MLFFYALLSLISDVMLGIFQKNASLVISLFAISENIFFSLLFYLFVQNPKIKKIIASISVICLCLIFSLFFLKKENFDFWAALITGIVIVVYSIFFFFEQVNSPQVLILYQSYKFWVVAGCIIYISGTLFLFLYTSNVRDRQKSALWIINIAFEIIKDICFSIGFLLARKPNQNILAQEYDDTNMLEKPF